MNCVHYGIEDGMLSVEGNGGNSPNSCKTRDGRLWFPTVKGVAIVDPRSVAGDELPPTVLTDQAVCSNPGMRQRLGGKLIVKLCPCWPEREAKSENEILPGLLKSTDRMCRTLIRG